MTATAAQPAKTAETALLSIGFLMDVVDRLHWKCGGGRGPWEGCLSALVLTLEPNCKTRRLLEALPVEGKMDRVSLLNTLANLGYAAHGAAIDLGDVEPQLMPCLFIPEMRETAPCVVLSSNDGILTVYDSDSHAIKTVAPDSRSAGIPGEAFFFKPLDRNRLSTSKFMRAGTKDSWFAAVVRRFSGMFWQILLACFALNVFALAPSLFIMAVYDRVISPADASALPALAAGVGIALVAEYALRAIRSEGLAWMTARLDNIVGSRIFAHLIGLPATMVEQASVAAQVARVKTFESVRDFFSSAVFLSFLEIPFVLIAAGVMTAIAGPLVAVPLLMVCAYVGLFFLMRHEIKGVMRLAAKASSARQQFVIDTFEKLPAIRVNGLTAAWDRKFGELAGNDILTSFRLGFLGTVAETLAHALTIIAAVLTVGFGAELIWEGKMTTGALVASMILVWRILLPFYSLCTMIPRLEQLRNSISQVNSLMDLDTEADTAMTAASLPALKGNVTIDDATLRYGETADPALRGLSFDLSAGKIAAITGRNGAGKSSVLKLLKGLYRPESGTVRVDGFDIRQMDAMELRRQIAYVPQQPSFFPGTILENVIIGNPFATMDDVEQALKIAYAWEDLKDRLHEDMASLPLSPEMAARISLARAYLQNARILLIDELPNAALNGQAGVNLKRYISDPDEKRTVILVTHRSDFLKMADVIVNLARGAVPAVGLRDSMLKKMKEAA